MSATAAPPRIFLSYARQDGEDCATALRLRLQLHHPGLTVWQDRAQLQGGVGWWAQIEQAIEQVQFMVAVMTPAALRSEFTALEWRRAREQGVCIFPVLGVPAHELEWSLLPPWRRKVHFYDLEKEWDSFVAHLHAPCTAARSPFMAPDLPNSHVHRPRELEAAVSTLLRTRTSGAALSVTALHGAGGFGKTTLAVAVCHDERVSDAFDDGILWVTLGQSPNLQQELSRLYAAISGDRPAFVDVEDAVLSLASKLESKDCLLIVDDAWRSVHLRPFLRAAGQCAVLVTTRQLDVAMDARCVEVDEMSVVEAMQVLGAGLGVDTADCLPALAMLARRLGEWPLLLKLCSSALRQRVQRGDTLAGALAYVDKAWSRRGPRAFDRDSARSREEAVAATFDVSLDLLLAQDRRHCAELSVFPEDAAMPLDVVAAYLGLDEFDADELALRLSNGALVHYSPSLRVIGMHDMTRSFLATLVADGAALHCRLLASLGDPLCLRSAYAWHWYAFHLNQAAKGAELQALLQNPEWMRAKLEATDVGSLVADYGHAAQSVAVQTLQSALRLAAPVLKRDKDQLRTQLHARLADTADADADRLRVALAQAPWGPWLRPLASTMPAANGTLECVIESDVPVAPAYMRRTRIGLSADGRWAVAVTPVGPLGLWDIQRRSARMLEVEAVAAIALADHAGSVLVGLSDGRLQHRDCGRLALIREMGMHPGPLLALACDAGQQVLASLSQDEVRTWDIASGRLLHSLAIEFAHVVLDFAVSAGGQGVVVCTDSEVLVLDFAELGRCRRLDCRELGLHATAVSPDGRLLLTQPHPGALRVWDLHSLTPLRGCPLLSGSLAQFASDSRAVVAASGREVLVHDLGSGQSQAMRGGHVAPIEALACSGSARRIVSAEAGRLLVWVHGEQVRQDERVEAHAGTVHSIAVSANGQWLVTASDAGARRWRLAQGTLVPAGSAGSGFSLVLFVSDDGGWLLGQGPGKEVHAKDIETGEYRSLPLGGAAEVGFDGTLRISGNSRWLVLAPIATPFPSGEPWRLDEWMRDDYHVTRLWDAVSGELHLFEGTVDPDAIAVQADERKLLCFHRGNILSWCLDTGLCQQGPVVFDFAWSHAVFSGNARHLLAWQHEGACVVAYTAGGAGRALCSSGAAPHWAISDDGAYAACWDRELMVWDLQSLSPFARFVGDSAITACRFVPGSHVIVAGEAVGHVHLLELCGMSDGGSAK